MINRRRFLIGAVSGVAVASVALGVPTTTRKPGHKKGMTTPVGKITLLGPCDGGYCVGQWIEKGTTVQEIFLREKRMYKGKYLDKEGYLFTVQGKVVENPSTYILEDEDIMIITPKRIKVD